MLVILLIFSNLNLILSFNFDLKEPIVKSLKNKESYFGYSIAQHLIKSSKTPYLLVGAPRDDLVFNGVKYNKSGAIYKCPIGLDSRTDCEQIAVDFRSRKSDEVTEAKIYLDDNLKEQFKGRLFEDQWFGVSLSSTGNGSFSACAHKYVHYYNFTTRDTHAAYGACYRFSNDFTQEYKHVPCLAYSHSVNTFYSNNYAYCQAGTSLSIIEDTTLLPSNQQDVYLSYGMPGALNFRGLVAVKAIGKNSITEYIYKNKTLCKFDIETDRPMSDGYCPNLWEKYSYTGMSHVLIRKYLNNNKLNLIAAGAPREGLYGMVRFFTNMFDVSFGQVTRHLNLTLRGEFKGSYFGFSIAACDVNGDKLDDLIVGAPYYSTKNEPNSGAVYLYLNHKTKGFSAKYVLNMTGPIRSLFGHAVSCLGDIDKDGFGDFAIGAPYEAETGGVYIYRGSDDAKKIKLSQKIMAKDLGENLETFGYSLNGGLDMDGNSYPDLAVGSIKSNTVFLLRSKQVIYIDSFVKDNSSLLEIDHKIKECRKDGVDLTCFSFEICFSLSNKNQNLDQISLPMLNYSLEAEPNNTVFSSRVYFSKTGTNFVSSLIDLNDYESCDSIKVLIKKENNDFVRPIKFLLSYKFDEEEREKSLNLNNIKKHPIVHEDKSKFEFEANFKKDCGSDKKCITDLKLNAYFVNLLIGENNVPLLSFKESDSVTVGVVLENGGEQPEAAYATQILIHYDERLDFIKKTEEEVSGFSCEINTINKNKINSLICKLTNDAQGLPFGANSVAKFNLTFSSTRLYRYANISSQPNILFKLEAKTLSFDSDLSNNYVELLAKLKVRANLYLYGTKTPEQVFYSDNSIIRGESAMQNLEQIGPIIEHTYIINNAGPFSVHSFNLMIDWPYETRLINFNSGHNFDFSNGKHLLYLIEKPTKIPNDHPINVICTSYNVDPLKLAENKGIQIKKKRSLNELEQKTEKQIDQASSRVAIIDCFSNLAYCYKINCTFNGEFSKDETISLKFTARLWNSTLVEDFANYEKVLIKSNAKIILHDEIHDDKPNDNENSVATIAYSKITVKIEKTLPIWLYLLSVLIGLVLLSLSTVGFWLLGFFERKKFGDDLYLQENEKVKKTPY